MSLHRLPADAVLIAGPDLDVLRYAVRTTAEARRRNALPPLAELNRLARLLAVVGQSDSDQDPGGDPDLMTTNEAAQRLGCSTRTIRRKARQLGGRMVGGRLLLDRAAVTEHVEGNDTA